MMTADTPIDSHDSRTRFRIAVIFAAIVHVLAILGVTFSAAEKDKKEIPPALEVTLVHTQSEQKPTEADFLAQANQEGGGDVAERVRPETPFPATVPVEQEQMTNPTPPMFIPEPRQPQIRTEVMTQAQSKSSISTEIRPERKNESTEESTAEMVSRSMNIASKEAEIGESLQAYAKLPRNKIITAQTKEYAYAAYMDGWRRKVERVGNLNFPMEARRRKLTGDVVMDVMLNSDGTISRVELLRSSGHAVLDDAALRIVHMASPYAKFTSEMKKETDVLHIIRTWRFRQGDTVEAH